MLLLGITGGIGSGKSYVAHLMQSHWGIPVYDCDAAARRLENDDPLLRAALVKAAGPEVYDARSGQLARSVLARFLFTSDENAAVVNRIVHPAVQRDLLRWAEGQAAHLLAVESAILYESGFDAMVDRVIFVDAPDEVRLLRAMQRDGASRSQIAARMARQDSARYKAGAHYLIRNDACTTTDELIAQIAAIPEISQLQKL
ncbi:MAG: dephospho-CoA kinase [Bacteroidaceae bacterium]|nr:dephospho-CoA kinase [Bacteroidaceae bacterium]